MQKKVRVLGLLILDSLCVNIAFFLAFWLRFDGMLENHYFQLYTSNWIVLTGIKLLVYAYFKLYRSLWRYASVDELMQVFLASFAGSVCTMAYMYLTQQGLPRSIYAMSFFMDFMAIGGIRFSYRILRRLKNGDLIFTNKNEKRALIVGGGDAGASMVKELKEHGYGLKPVGIVDDSDMRQGQRIHGVTVLGKIEEIPDIVVGNHIDQIIICIPSAKKKAIKRIVTICKKTKAEIKTLPSLPDLIEGKVNLAAVREVNIEDLLGREENVLDAASIEAYLTDKCILVTGGGGSIGSELCRQIAKYHPKKLVIFDIYENNAYDIQQELIREYGNRLCLEVYIGSVRDEDRLREIFDKVRPEVVFHAAAHKHVPLMENSPKEAIKNNVFGTHNAARMANEYGVKKFVLISTDKAVNPTNIMGASKRLCEMVIQSMNTVSATDYVAVRFGNVLGSNGSVIPLFKNQIANGGPVKLTHEDIIRYFMTIPEAAQLVMQAGALAKGGEIFVLDMGEPVKIKDLAEDLIRLSGFEPYVDIDIEVVGLRPGEKLYEELLMAEEGLTGTANAKIFIGKATFEDYGSICEYLEKLRQVVEAEEECIKAELQKIVPTYSPS